MKMSKNYKASVTEVDVKKVYEPSAAIENAIATAKAKFDETIELHVRLGVDPRQADQQVRGTVVLPNGTGKKVKVLVIAKGEKADAAEAAGGYTVAHCDSVALGMYCEALLAEHIGICRRGTAEEIAGIAGRYNTFPALPPRKALLEAMSHDKKFSGGRRVFALPERIGSVVLREVGFGELCSFLDKLYM